MNKNFRVSLLGYMFYYLIPIRKKIIQDNINLVFTHYSLHEKKKLAQAFYSHLATTLKEVFFMGYYSKKHLNHLVTIKGIEHLLAAQKKGRGVMLLTGHFGNWELTSLIAMSQLKPLIGLVHAIRKSIRIKWFQRLLFNRVECYGMQIIGKDKASSRIIRALKKNEIILFVMDQHSVLDKEGIAVDFFGHKAGTYRSLAFFAEKYGCPVIPLSSYRQINGTHTFEFHPELLWEDYSNKEQAIYNNTLRYNQKLEEFILAHPEQWWWVHRRWKL